MARTEFEKDGREIIDCMIDGACRVFKINTGKGSKVKVNQTGKSVLVTGAAGGIGSVIVRALNGADESYWDRSSIATRFTNKKLMY